MNSFMYLRLSQVTRQTADAPEDLKFASFNAWVGLIICTLCVLLAFISPISSLLVVAGVWIWWSLPQAN